MHEKSIPHGRGDARRHAESPLRKEVKALRASSIEDDITSAVSKAVHDGPHSDPDGHGYVAIKIMLLSPSDHELLAALQRLIQRGEPVGRLRESLREWVLPACWNGLRAKYLAALKVCASLAPRGVHLSIVRRPFNHEPFTSKEKCGPASLAVAPPNSFVG